MPPLAMFDFGHGCYAARVSLTASTVMSSPASPLDERARAAASTFSASDCGLSGCSSPRYAHRSALVSRLSHIFMDTVFREGKILHPTCTLAFYDPKRRFYNHFCTKFCKFAGSKGARLLMKSRWTFCILTTVISPSEFVFFGRLWKHSSSRKSTVAKSSLKTPI